MIGIGIACRGKQENVKDYFTAGGKMTGFFASMLVGLSIAATFFSGISFIMYPSVIYTNGLTILMGVLLFPIIWAILRFWFLPQYLSRGASQPYDVVEQKFGPRIRSIAALMFILLRVGWMAALIYTPTLAIMASAGLGNEWLWPLVIIIGLSSTIYTVMGGIRGVIITDAIQFIIIIAGILITIIYVLWNIPVSPTRAWDILKCSGTLKLFDFSLNMNSITTWSVLCGFMVANMASYAADQMSLQRYLAVGSIQSASRSFGINVIGVVIVFVLLTLVGLSMVVWYKVIDDPNLPRETDRIFPYFIATCLPTGIAGGLLAAILAATMSSMTSGINSLSASLTMDFREQYKKPVTPLQELRFAKISSLVIGLASTGLAGFVGKMGTIFQISQGLLGVFLGPLLCCIILSLLNRTIQRLAVIVGLLVGCAVGWTIVCTNNIDNIWTAPMTFLTSLLVTWIMNTLLKKTKLVHIEP